MLQKLGDAVPVCVISQNPQTLPYWWKGLVLRSCLDRSLDLCIGSNFLKSIQTVIIFIFIQTCERGIWFDWTGICFLLENVNTCRLLLLGSLQFARVSGGGVCKGVAMGPVR